MEKALVAEPMVGHTMGVEVQSENMSGKVWIDGGREHNLNECGND